jgi:hypothetical protein
VDRQLRCLQRLNAVDVNQGDVNETIRFRVHDANFVGSDCDDFRVAHRISLAVRETDLERLERLPPHPFPDCVRIHCGALSTDAWRKSVISLRQTD